MGALNKSQAYELFQRESVMIGDDDVVPVFRAAELLGERAVKFVENHFDRRYSNGFGVESYTLNYLTLQGFLRAVSYYNVQQLQQECNILRAQCTTAGSGQLS